MAGVYFNGRSLTEIKLQHWQNLIFRAMTQLTHFQYKHVQIINNNISQVIQ